MAVSPQDAFYAEKESLAADGDGRADLQRVCHVLSAGNPHSGARESEITEEILDYIVYAKEKGCSMTGPEDAAIERLNVLKGG